MRTDVVTSASARRRRARLHAALLLTLAGIGSAWLVSAGATDAAIAFPDGYTRWTHIKSGLINPGHPAHARFGGLHHIYANEQGVAGYRNRDFGDGSILIYDLFEARPTADGSIDQGPRRHVDVMVKDSRRYGDTGGWGYAEFAVDTRDDRLDPRARASCAGCHAHRKDRGYVFSELQD